MLRRWLSLLTLVALGATAAACTAETGDDADEQALAGACPLSPLGQSVADAAQRGNSTTSQVLTRQNIVSSGPIIGPEAYAEAMSALVRSAKREVRFEVFLFDDGWLAARLRDAIATLDPHIPVLVLVTSDLTRAQPDGPDRIPGIAQTTADRVLNILDPGRTHNVIVGAWQLKNAVGIDINHDKAIVVDGERAIVSNINLEFPSDPSKYNPQTGQTWYQMAIAVDGEVARSVAEEFRTAWTHVGAVAASRAVTKVNPAALPEYSMSQLFDDRPLPPLGARFEDACVPMVTLGRELYTKDDSSANAGFLAMFANAKRNVNVTTPNLNATSALRGLAEATKHADVNIVMSRGFTEKLESLPGQGGGNDHVVDERLVPMLREVGGDPCRMHVRWYARPEAPGVEVYGESEGASHTKFASADGQVMILGSQNMDTQSWTVSRELSVAIDHQDTTKKFDDEWRRVWSRSTCAYECGGCRR